MLSAVFERGVGAYNTNPGSVRPSVTGPEQWAYARVNAFLFAVRTGRYKGGTLAGFTDTGAVLVTREKLGDPAIQRLLE